MAKSLVEMAQEIITAQSNSGKLGSEDLGEALRKTFKILQELQKSETVCEEVPAETGGIALQPGKSIQKNKIVCLECGEEFKMLSPRHLKSHGLTGKEYRKKYGFSMRQPLCAKGLSEERKKAAKERGIPAGLQKVIDERKKKAKNKIKE